MDKLILLPPPVAAVLLAGIGFAFDRLLPGIPPFSLPILGQLLVAVGISLMVSTAVGFRRYRTTILPHGNPSIFITIGAYVWSRNPIYLGLLTALFGFALYFGGLALFLAPPAFVILIGRVHIRHEEAKLSANFGETYADYCRRVSRWL